MTAHYIDINDPNPKRTLCHTLMAGYEEHVLDVGDSEPVNVWVQSNPNAWMRDLFETGDDRAVLAEERTESGLVVVSEERETQRREAHTAIRGRYEEFLTRLVQVARHYPGVLSQFDYRVEDYK